jgi:hypothetical protein
MSDKPDQIHAALLKIMEEIGAIEKDRSGSGIQYKFRGVDDVYNAAHGPMVSNGVYCTPEVLEKSTVDAKTSTGKFTRLSSVTVRYTFRAADGSSVSTITSGEALDSGDKGIAKATSVAHRITLVQMFCIPTEESRANDVDNASDELADTSTPPPELEPTNTPFIIDNKPVTREEALAHIAEIDNIPHLKNWYKKNKGVICLGNGDVRQEYMDINNAIIARDKEISEALSGPPPDEVSDVEPF